MSLQEELVTETEIAKRQQILMDAEPLPTSTDDIPSKNIKRQIKLERKKLNDAIKYWDEREIKRVCYDPETDPNRKHAGMQKQHGPSMADLWFSNSKYSSIIMESTR